MLFPFASFADDAGITVYSDLDVFFEVASVADLVSLREDITLSLLSSPEYESVNVPAGVYQVGTDIPEGKWSLTSSVKTDMDIGSKLKDNGHEIQYGGDYYVTDSDLRFTYGYLYKDNEYVPTIYQNVDLPMDAYVVISKGSVDFSTFIGQPDFLFYAATLPDSQIQSKFDFSNMSFSDLTVLKDGLNMRIWSSYKWDKVIVPVGMYKVGVDIPAGYFCVESPNDYTRISYGQKLYAHYLDLEIYDDWEQEIENVNYSGYKEGDLASVNINLEEGYYLSVNENTCASFSPAVEKKASLGFKKYATEETTNGSDESPKTLYQFTLKKTNGTGCGPATISTSSNSLIPDTCNGKQYSLLDYDDVARNPSSYDETPVYFTGTVIQVSESTLGLSTSYRVKLDNDSSDVVLVRKYTATEPRVLEDDHVIVYGTCSGVESYSSVLGGIITIPSCTAVEIIDYSTPPLRKPDPMTIVDCKTGEAANISVVNNTELEVKEVYFRCKFYDSDGSLMFADVGGAFDADAYYTNPYLVGLECVVPKGRRLDIDCTSLDMFVNADHMETALLYYATDDGIYYVPENHLYWYSSTSNSYIENQGYEFTYSYPDQSIFDAQDKFSMGFYYALIYPEYAAHYSLSCSGVLITEFSENSYIEKQGVKVGDILISCNGVSIEDDPYVVEKAKASIVAGETVDFVFSREGTLYSITIGPSSQ